MSIGQDVSTHKRKSNNGDSISGMIYHKNDREETRSKLFEELSATKQEGHNEVINTDSTEVKSKYMGSTPARNSHSLENKSNDGNKIFTFNNKLNSFSKESTDLLDWKIEDAAFEDMYKSANQSENDSPRVKSLSYALFKTDENIICLLKLKWFTWCISS